MKPGFLVVPQKPGARVSAIRWDFSFAATRLGSLEWHFPRLTPWATFCRCSAAISPATPLTENVEEPTNSGCSALGDFKPVKLVHRGLHLVRLADQVPGFRVVVL